MSTSTPVAPVETGKVAGRRTLHFETIDQMMAEVDRLVEAERAGHLKRLGNWTLGQTLGHLAAWAEFNYTGWPFNPPFFVKWIARLRKQKFLWQPMRAGVKIPGVKGGTLATDPMSTDEALPRFRQVMARLKEEPPTQPHCLFGQLTHKETIACNLRHAELHLSFLVPD